MFKKYGITLLPIVDKQMRVKSFISILIFRLDKHIEYEIYSFHTCRGSSKRIPKKYLSYSWEILIEYTFEKITELGWEGKTFVSSDMEEIKLIAKNYGINFIARPNSLSKDESSTESALFHTLTKLENDYEFVITLPPTSPMLKSSSIIKAVKIFKSKFRNIDSLISVHESKDDIWHYENNIFKRIFPEEPRDSKTGTLFIENSAVYITKISSLLKTK